MLLRGGGWRREREQGYGDDIRCLREVEKEREAGEKREKEGERKRGGEGRKTG